MVWINENERTGQRKIQEVRDGKRVAAFLHLNDPFQDAVPCWHPDKIHPREPHPLETLASRMGNNNAFRK